MTLDDELDDIQAEFHSIRKDWTKFCQLADAGSNPKLPERFSERMYVLELRINDLVDRP